MNKLKVYKFIVIKKKKMTPSLDIECRVGGVTDMPEQENAELVVKDLDTIDELRESVAVRIASYQRSLANSYNKLVKPRMFQPGDLVLRKVFENTTDRTTGKFQPN